MRILMLNYEYPPLGGGAGKITRNMAINLAALGHSVTVITAGFKDIPQTQTDESVTILRVPSRRKKHYKSNPWEMLSWVKETKKYLREWIPANPCDFCIANFSIPGGLVGRFLKRKFGIPYAVMSHGHDIPWMYKRQMFIYHLFLFPVIKNICKNSACNFVQSLSMKRNIDRFLGRHHAAKNILIPNGFTPGECINTASKAKEFSILFAGRMVGQKDPMTLLYALKKLNGMDIPFKAYMIGDGPLRKKLQKFANANLPEDSVIFTGWIPENEVNKYYEQSHVMVMPSLFEGMSMVNLEALSCGLYLITTPVSGNTEMFDTYPHGKLVEPGDYKEISHQLQKLYFNCFLPNNWNGDTGRENFAKKFNWAEISRQYEKAINAQLG